MKNIHILPKDIFNQLGVDHYGKTPTQIKIAEFLINKNIYITSDEEIKANEWFYSPNTNSPQVYGHNDIPKDRGFKKIILTTDVDLIKDGVQAIEDEFLEWFVKNPSCEEVEVVKHISDMSIYVDDIKKCIDVNLVEYEITIPKEEPEQDTLEAAEKLKSTEEENYLNLMRIEESANEYSKTVPDAYGIDDFAREGFTMGAYSESAKKYWYTIFKHEENAK